MEVILYSTHCPRCNVIEQKLKSKNVNFTEVNNVEEIEQKGFKQVPMLEVDGEIMDFVTANKWVNNL